MTVIDQNVNHNQQHRTIAPHTKSLTINEEPPPPPPSYTNKHKQTTTYDVENPDFGLERTQTCGGKTCLLEPTNCQ